jgi:Zn-dependent peptidase ImmA (M78 family)/transcriptional regulator with XRE-family HTH domain
MPVSVNPEILVWARQSAGLDVDAAARKLGLSNSAKSSAGDKLSALEAGEKQPTRKQLDIFSQVYKRPLLTFYLLEPPTIGQRGQDFRQTPDARGYRDNGMLDALLRDVKARQELVRDILVDEEDFVAPDFVGSARLEDGVPTVVQRIADRLGFDHTDISLRAGNPNDLFNRLRKCAEDVGIFVLVLGDLGSNNTQIGASVFRGFAIADPIAPFAVINAKDARPARAFTLIHEIAHLWLGQTGVSGDISTASPRSQNARIERFCNDVAGEFLLPEGHFRQAATRFEPSDVEGARACIDLVAARWSVSEPMVAYRFQRVGELTDGAYATLRQEYQQRWIAHAAREKEKQKQTNGGPSGHVIRQFNLGNAFVDVVYRNFRDRNLTHTKAARLLGSQPISVPRFFDFIEGKRRRALQSNGGQV